MKRVTQNDHALIVATLKAGGVVVLRTDTIYGIVAAANNRTACDKVFALKKRAVDKSCIVLIADDTQMWDEASRAAYSHIAPQLDDDHPSSLVVPAAGRTPTWLYRSDHTVAYRIPTRQSWLIAILRDSGPIIAPSANLEGQPPASSIDEAVAYFGEGVTVYVDGGVVDNPEASHVYRYDGMKVERLR